MWRNNFFPTYLLVLSGAPNGVCIITVNSGIWPPIESGPTTLGHSQLLPVRKIHLADGGNEAKPIRCNMITMARYFAIMMYIYNTVMSLSSKSVSRVSSVFASVQLYGYMAVSSYNLYTHKGTLAKCLPCKIKCLSAVNTVQTGLWVDWNSPP